MIRCGKKSVVRVARRVAALVPSTEKSYIGETGRKFGTRFKEHKTEVESITSKPFTRNQHASSLSEQNKSALIDHASHDNHVINWSAAAILDGYQSTRHTVISSHSQLVTSQLVTLASYHAVNSSQVST